MTNEIEGIAADLEDLIGDMEGVTSCERVGQSDTAVVLRFVKNGTTYSLTTNCITE